MQGYIKPLDHLRTNKFIATLLQAMITDQNRVLYSLFVNHGGLGIPILYLKYQKNTTNIRNEYQHFLLQLLSWKDLNYQTVKL